MRTAVVIGASGGIGAALVDKLKAEPAFDAVIAMGRSTEHRLDLLDENSIVEAASYLQGKGYQPELVIVASGVLHDPGHRPEKSIAEMNPEWSVENFRVNAVGPALIAKHFLPIMPTYKRICFAALSARVGSISDNRLGGWHSYRASKAALNMLIRNIAIEWQRKNPQSIIVGMHPGTVESALSGPFRGNAASERFAPEQAAEKLLSVLDALDPLQSGQLFSYDGKVIAP